MAALGRPRSAGTMPCSALGGLAKCAISDCYHAEVGEVEGLRLCAHHPAGLRAAPLRSSVQPAPREPTPAPPSTRTSGPPGRPTPSPATEPTPAGRRPGPTGYSATPFRAWLVGPQGSAHAPAFDRFAAWGVAGGGSKQERRFLPPTLDRHVVVEAAEVGPWTSQLLAQLQTYGRCALVERVLEPVGAGGTDARGNNLPPHCWEEERCREPARSGCEATRDPWRGHPPGAGQLMADLTEET